MPGMFVAEDADYTYEFDPLSSELTKVPKTFSAANKPPTDPALAAPAAMAAPAPAAPPAATPNGAPTPSATPAGPGGANAMPPAPAVSPATGGSPSGPPSVPARSVPARAKRRVSPGFRATLETESSGGRNKSHRQIKDPDHPYYLHTAAGVAGLMPQNVLHLVRDYPDLRAKHFPRIKAALSKEYDDDEVLSQSDADRVTAIVNADEGLDYELAERFWKEHSDDTATKDPATGKVVRLNDDRAYALWRGGPEGLSEYDKFMATGQQSKTRPKTISDTLRYKRNRSQFQDPNGYDVDVAQSPPMPGAPPAPPVPTQPPAGPGGAPSGDLRGELDPAFPDLEFRPLTTGPGGAPTVAGARVASGTGSGLSPTEEILKKKPDPNDPSTWEEDPEELGSAVPVGTLDAEAIARREAELGGRANKANLTGKSDDPTAGAGAAPAAPAPPPEDDLRARIRDARKVFERDFGGAAPDIDPQRLWKNRGNGMRVLAAVSAALGAAGAALSGGPNTAWEIIQQAISDDLDAQRATGEDRARRAQQMLAHINSMIDELAIDQRAAAASGKPGARPPASMVKDAQLIDTGFASLDKLEKMYTDLSAVDWAKSAGGWAPWATAASAYEAERDQVLTDIIFNYSGKQTNPSEIDRLTRALPSAYKVEGTEKGLQRMRAMRASLQRKASALDTQAKNVYGKSLVELSAAEKQKLPGAASIVGDVAADLGFDDDVSDYEEPVDEAAVEGAE